MILFRFFLCCAVVYKTEGFPSGNILEKSVFPNHGKTLWCDHYVHCHCSPDACKQNLGLDLGLSGNKEEIPQCLSTIKICKEQETSPFRPAYPRNFLRQEDDFVHNLIENEQVGDPSVTTVIIVLSSLFALGCLLMLLVHLYFRRRIRNIRAQANLLTMSKQAADNEYTEMPPPPPAREPIFQFDPNTDISQNTHCRLELIV